MKVTIRPSKIRGTIGAPASKSSMQRACAAALLYSGETRIHNPGHSADDQAALRVIQGLGAEVLESADGSLIVKSQGVKPGKSELNCGESGLGIRMFAPIMALSDQPIVVSGRGSLLSRPMDFFDSVFPLLGVQVESNQGKLPMKIKGPLHPKNITIDGSLSSQFLTGLLMAYASAGAKGVSIKVIDLKSKPYIDLTIGVMKHFGWMVENRGYEEFYFEASSFELRAASRTIEYTVEGDWSGGAFLLVAGAIAGPIVVKGLDGLSTQADRAILQALKDCGAALEIGSEGGAEGIRVGRGLLRGFHFDATDCPDLFPPLVALAAYCQGETVLEGVDRLAHKESNRGLTLREEFAKMGVEVRLEGNIMRVNGGAGLRGAIVHSRHDHRIAMACAVAGLGAEGETIIEEADAVNKSYPDFYAHLQMLGAGVLEQQDVVNGPEAQ